MSVTTILPTMIVTTSNPINTGPSSDSIGAIVDEIFGELGTLTLISIFIIFIKRRKSIIIPDIQPVSESPAVQDTNYEQPCGRLFPKKDHIKNEHPSERTEHDGGELSRRINKS